MECARLLVMNAACYEMRMAHCCPEEQLMLESESGNGHAEGVPNVMETMAACRAALSRRVAGKFEH